MEMDVLNFGAGDFNRDDASFNVSEKSIKKNILDNEKIHL
jgi:hypothetical protein